MDRKRIICLIFGILLCILPGGLIGWYILEFVLYYANGIYSMSSPESWFVTGMLVLGIILIIFGLDIKVIEELNKD